MRAILLFAFIVLLQQYGFAQALEFNYVRCDFYEGSELQRSLTQKMIPLVIDEDYGSFVQIQWGDLNKVIQYQLLIENAPTGSELPYVVLQNLLVREIENSVEIYSAEPSSLEISQDDIQIKCQALKI